MTTRELAESLCGITDADEVERRLLLFLVEQTAGYGPEDTERSRVRRFAEQRGYFWLPCPTCSRWFSGQEWDGASVSLTRGRATGVCPVCVPEARRINERWPDGLRYPDPVPETVLPASSPPLS